MKDDTATIRPERDRHARARTFFTIALRADRPLSLPTRLCLDGCSEVQIARAEAFRCESAGEGVMEVRIEDSSLSSRHLRLRRVGGRWWLEDAGSKNGTMVDGRRVDRTELHDGAVIEAGHTFFVFRACETEVSGEVLGAEEVQGAPRGLATMHPGLQDAFATLASVARSRLPVLIRGETGTGKELVANAVHGMSGRPGAIVPVNCASIPEDLLHAELFGARRGSYSGATADRPGLVQAAERGTLFLDEIAELPPRAQVILLRLLQECEITPLGSTRPVPIDVRFAAATHADVNAPGFRPDVLARLSGHVIGLPPLRDRREDIGLLIATILVEAGVDRDISMSLPVARALMAARWRLNIRQLRHSLLAATLMAGGRIASSHMTIEEAPPPRPPGVGAASAGPPPAGTSGRVDAARLRDLLQLHGGNISAVARALTTSRTQVTRLMRRFGLDPLGNSSGQ